MPYTHCLPVQTHEQRNPLRNFPAEVHFGIRGLLPVDAFKISVHTAKGGRRRQAEDSNKATAGAVSGR